MTQSEKPEAPAQETDQERAAREAKEREVAEAQLAAEVSAQHAAEAAAQAAADDLAAKQATKEDPKAKLCPTCKSEMIRHGNENPFKAGCWHCNGCGSCWQPNLKQMREGHAGPAPASAE